MGFPEETLQFRERIRAVVGGSAVTRLVPDRGRVDDSQAPAALLRQRAPVRVEPPAHAQRREGQQLRGDRRARTRSAGRSRPCAWCARPIQRARRNTRPGGVAGVASARAGRARSPRRSRTTRNRSRKPRGSSTSSSTTRIQSRVRRAATRASSAFRFSNLPRSAQARRAASRARSAGSGLAERPEGERAPSRRRASQLRDRTRHRCGVVGARRSPSTSTGAAAPERAARSSRGGTQRAATTAASSARSRSRARSRARRPLTMPLSPTETRSGSTCAAIRRARASGAPGRRSAPSAAGRCRSGGGRCATRSPPARAARRRARARPRGARRSARSARPRR